MLKIHLSKRRKAEKGRSSQHYGVNTEKSVRNFLNLE